MLSSDKQWVRVWFWFLALTVAVERPLTSVFVACGAVRSKEAI